PLLLLRQFAMDLFASLRRQPYINTRAPNCSFVRGQRSSRSPATPTACERARSRLSSGASHAVPVPMLPFQHHAKRTDAHPPLDGNGLFVHMITLEHFSARMTLCFANNAMRGTDRSFSAITAF